MAALVHIAGPVVAARQECSRCGFELEDHQGAMVPEDQAASGLPFWEEGSGVIVDGNAAFVTDPGTYPPCKPVDDGQPVSAP